MKLSAFKAYDIRGRIPDEINEDLARAVGRAYAGFVKPARVVVGHDMRLTSPSLAAALTRGLTESGVDVYDIGQCGTEGVYFATAHGKGADGANDLARVVVAAGLDLLTDEMLEMRREGITGGHGRLPQD